MSKSKGNVVTPVEILERHSTDAIRYWACAGRLGIDTAIDEGKMKVGRKLAIKLLNASRFVLGSVAPDGPDDGAAVTETVDRSLLASLAALVDDATAAFDGYDHARALECTEAWFWGFCDDYLELVKGRAYNREAMSGEGSAASARAALRIALSVLLRLFAPVLAFTTEEIWSWWHPHGGSIHRSTWPEAVALPAGGDPTVVATAASALASIRRAKTEAGLSLRAPVTRLVATAPAAQLAALRSVEADLRQAGVVAGFVWVEDGANETTSYRVELAGAAEQ